MRHYVVYTRVSTAEQGRSGLGLEAQKRDIDLFLTNYSDVPWEIVGEYRDVQSGGDDDRPQLQAALEQCRRTGAELLVAKLDRLSRKVSFIAQLMDDPKVRLRVATMPQADKFQLHIYAALAEQERDFISARTKAALKAAKARGKALGGLRDTTMRRNAAIQQKAATEAQKLLQIIGPMRDAGQTLEAIASALDRLGVATSRGGKWTAKQVSRVLARRTNASNVQVLG
jgi:DNA invertase Pin-like site-specific DNA recombinase